MRRTIRTAEQNTSAEWTAERLRALLATVGRGQSVAVLANREPFRHDRTADGDIVVRRSVGGLVTALEPLMEACSGVWVAHGSGTADRDVVDRHDRVVVPCADRSYRLRRVWLDASEERGYYDGFANEGLWPLCHRARVQPIFRVDDFAMYRRVNARFSEAISEEVGDVSPVVLVQDYHFALAPANIRRRLPRSTIVTFWHIPWPHPDDFAICPWSRQLLDGLLGSTVVGFQTSDDCENFIEAVADTLDVHVDWRQKVLTRDGRCTAVRVFPVSVEWPNRWAAQAPPIECCRALLLRQFGLAPNVRLIVGVDRLDYTKGIVEKCLAMERLLEANPELRERLALVQIAAPSRDRLSEYRTYRSRLAETVDRINARFGAGSYRPIVLLEANHDPAEVHRFLRAATVCYVNSLHDGMNLVAKEFVSARDDNRGVLVLSQFAGAARELTGALLVNPYSINDSAAALVQALNMSDGEQLCRMRAMRSMVAQFNTYRWAADMMMEATRWRVGGARGWCEETGRFEDSNCSSGF
jgi:trehalose 6-phosphate synthase